MKDIQKKPGAYKQSWLGYMEFRKPGALDFFEKSGFKRFDGNSKSY